MDKLDKLVQVFGHISPIIWTRLSNLLDKLIQSFGHVWLNLYIYKSCPINDSVQPVSLVQADE